MTDEDYSFENSTASASTPGTPQHATDSAITVRRNAPAPTGFKIEVVALKVLPPGTTMKAFADVQISEGSLWVQVNGCRLLQPMGKDSFVAFPQREYEVKGEKKYQSIVRSSREVSNALLKAVLEALAENPNGFYQEGR